MGISWLQRASVVELCDADGEKTVDDLARFCCHNPECRNHGQRGAGNLTVCMRYGKHQHLRLLYCGSCKARFSERQGTPFFGAKLAMGQMVSVLDHISEGCGVRKTSRLTGVHRDTVLRYSRLAGEQAQDLHDVLVAFSPQTREVQFDEKWAFVGKKQHHCDPDDLTDTEQGDNWDHVAFDPAHRLVVSVVPGKRTTAKTAALVNDVHRRTGGRMMDLLVSDEYSAYKTAMLQTYGETITPPRTGKPGRPKKPYIVAPVDLQYATVHKTRHKGRVVHVETRIVFGEEDAIRAALAASPVSTTINTAFVERHHGTDRNRNGRKVRRTACFSKDWQVHNAVTYFTMYSYNFCWPVRTLRVRQTTGEWQQRTPAMAAGLADHVWSLTEWLTFPVVQLR
jgi:IS1 family transposase